MTAKGRLYFIVNEAPTSLAGPESPPDKWSLQARDAFNGALLWKRPIRDWGWRQWKPSWFTPRPGVIPLNLDKRLVAAGDRLYATLGFRAPVSEIDGRTGKILRTFAGTERTSEILHLDRSLVLTVLQNERAIVKRIDLDKGHTLWESEMSYAGTTVDYYRFTAMRGSVEPAMRSRSTGYGSSRGSPGLLRRTLGGKVALYTKNRWSHNHRTSTHSLAGISRCCGRKRPPLSDLGRRNCGLLCKSIESLKFNHSNKPKA